MKRRHWTVIFIIALLGFVMGCSDAGNPHQTEPAATDTGDREKLALRLDAPSSYQAKYTSQTGISVITVDAEVVVPDAYTVDVVEAVPRAFTDEEVISFIDRHSENLVWMDCGDEEEYNGHGFQLDANSGSDLGISHYMLWIHNYDEFYTNNGDCYSIFALYGLNQRTGKLAWEPQLEYIKSRFNLSADTPLPLTDGRALGCTIPLEQALAYADAEVHALCADYEMTSYGQLPVWETVDNPQYYVFRYTRHLSGIPVSDDYGGESCDNEYDFTSGLGVITVIVRDDGVCYVSYNNPYDVGEVIERDCELLSFDQIMDIFARVGLLSIQHLERNEDLQENTLQVYRIQFGYMAVRQPDDVDAYYYVPVWDFYGTRVLYGTGGYAHGKDAGFEMRGNSELTINAIDGTVIDRTYGY